MIMTESFRAILVSRDAEKKQTVETVSLTEADLMEGDVTVKVEATTVNYKDGLAITGKSPVVWHWPMVPGIDLAGTVVKSQSPQFREGDQVLLNGYGVGETHWGAYAGMARLKAEWLIPLPKGLTAKQAMGVGTAGYTAMLCVMALERHGMKPQHGPAVVTGANGGVGTVAISLLSQLGWHVIASTGRTSEDDFLKSLGASEIIDRAELSQPGKPLARERWAAGIDSVGSHTLANLLAQTQYNGAIAACGLAQGFDLPATVMPFILRCVALLGVDSVMAARERRIEAWDRIAAQLDMKKLDALTTTIGFDGIIAAANEIVAGKIRGRVIVDMKD
jgi:acrylyl-CoA reductase (NADPH)